MFQTMGGNPRNFNKLDLYSLPSPCFVIDKKALQDNLEILYELKEDTNVKILLAVSLSIKIFPSNLSITRVAPSSCKAFLPTSTA